MAHVGHSKATHKLHVNYGEMFEDDRPDVWLPFAEAGL
jgi:hypothetical protein